MAEVFASKGKTRGDIWAEGLKAIATNEAYLNGYLQEEFIYSHSNHGANFYRSEIRATRLSGADDVIPVIVTDSTIFEKELKSFTKGQYVMAKGRFSSYNEKKTDGKNHLVLSILAKELKTCDAQEVQPTNFIFVKGVICKPPVYRTTPLGKAITDLMIAINRKYGKSDYIPCIAWERVARLVSELKVGDELCFWGRMQSRPYVKKIGTDEVEERIAREVSIMRLMD